MKESARTDAKPQSEPVPSTARTRAARRKREAAKEQRKTKPEGAGERPRFYAPVEEVLNYYRQQEGWVGERVLFSDSVEEMLNRCFPSSRFTEVDELRLRGRSLWGKVLLGGNKNDEKLLDARVADFCVMEAMLKKRSEEVEAKIEALDAEWLARHGVTQERLKKKHGEQARQVGRRLWRWRYLWEARLRESVWNNEPSSMRTGFVELTAKSDLKGKVKSWEHILHVASRDGDARFFECVARTRALAENYVYGKVERSRADEDRFLFLQAYVAAQRRAEVAGHWFLEVMSRNLENEKFPPHVKETYRERWKWATSQTPPELTIEAIVGAAQMGERSSLTWDKVRDAAERLEIKLQCLGSTELKNSHGQALCRRAVEMGVKLRN